MLVIRWLPDTSPSFLVLRSKRVDRGFSGKIRTHLDLLSIPRLGRFLWEQNLVQKVLIFSTRFSCENLAVEDFVTLLMGKNLVDGEMLCLGMISAYLYMLFYAGEIQNSNKLPKAGNGNVFFPNKRVRFARADKAEALQYHNQ